MPRRSKTNKEKSSSNLIIGVLFVVLVAGALYVAWQYMGEDSEEADNINVAETVTADNLNSDEISWQTYTNKEEGYLVDYPIDWDIDSTLEVFMTRDYIADATGAKVKVEVMNVELGNTWQEQARAGLLTFGEKSTVGGVDVLQETVESDEGESFVDIISFPSSDDSKVVTMSLNCPKDGKSIHEHVFIGMVETFQFIGVEEEDVNENEEEKAETSANTYASDAHGYQFNLPNDWKEYVISDARVGLMPDALEPSEDYLGDITVSYRVNSDDLSIEEYYNGRHGIDYFTDAQGAIEDLNVSGLAAKKFNNVMGYTMSTIVIIPVTGGFIEINDNNNLHQGDGIFDQIVNSFSI